MFKADLYQGYVPCPALRQVHDGFNRVSETNRVTFKGERSALDFIGKVAQQDRYIAKTFRP
ncbi:MAG: hypothetical protein ABSH29_07185 [Acidimicrobiales bacterium]|jgi:hypothetical protein